MYYNEEELERIRKQGEEYSRRQEEDTKGAPFTSAAGLQIYCAHCKHDHFEIGKALLNTRGMSYLGLDWLNAGARTLMCKRCGYIHWFASNVTEIESK